jgi:uncharacterized hydrophobic protein (TIGR00271 family)
VSDHRDPRAGVGDDTGELEPVTAHDEGVDHSVRPVADRSRTGLAWIVVQGLLGGIVLVLIVIDPYSFTAIEEIVGFGLVAFGLLEIIHVVRRRGGLAELVQPLAALVGGLVLIVWPDQTRIVAGYFLAGVIIVRGVSDIAAALRSVHEIGANAWVFVRGLIALALGGLMALFPAQSVEVVAFGGALLLVFRAVIAVWFATTNRRAVAIVDPADTYGVITYWLSRREMGAADADDVEMRVFLTRGEAKARIWRFGILMALATAIATFGLATDSTAVVIGAMLIAPLMTPILGTAAGLINGKTRSTASSAAITILGSLGAILLALLLAGLIPDLDAVVQNAQITSRTSPSLLDLAIAVAAGAAGAYGVSRAESTDALPGVAVAIALVPPLAVIGITLRAGDTAQASGAFLLFLTNLFSIILMAGLVFVLVGYSTWSRLYHRRNRIRVAFAAVAFAVVLIAIPLALTGRDVLSAQADLRAASEATAEWLGDERAIRITSISVEDDDVTVELVGSDPPPPAVLLASRIDAAVGRPVVVTVRWIEERVDEAGVRRDSSS